MKALYTSAQCRELDRLMIEQEGVAGFELMLRAGRAAFDELLHRWSGIRSVSICCGKGNNAGDGYIIAGLAQEIGLEAQLLQVGDATQLSGDAALAKAWAEERDVVLSQGDAPFTGEVIVDALLGTGLSGPLREPFKTAVEHINASGLPVLAVDVPSGVNADTGAVADTAVCADVTVSFIGAKLGLHTGFGLAVRGALVQAGLGVTDAVLAQVPGCPWLQFDAAELPATSVNQHKHGMGHLVVVGGDAGMGGAPLMAAEAALRTGTGLVSLLTRPEHHAAILARRPELMA
ncbi:MAG: NAD(P)H-hydrate epimerase, partial [Gammaproteobacteria bacterium]|nr:NAD(P)H-hydrate epimerase [Gammaproteobacteria bacterium]